MKQFYLIIVSHGESEPDEIKIDIALEDLWKFLNNLSYDRHRVQSFWSIIQLETPRHLSEVSLSTSWSNLDETVDCSSKIVEETDGNKNRRNSSLANIIHRLCDSLPSTEFCVVDVIWIANSLNLLPSFQDNILLYGALKRLIKWFKARLTICNCEDVVVPSFTWDQVLPLQITKYPFAWEQILFENVMWRGGIQHYNQTSGTKTNLCGFQLRSTKQRDFSADNYDDYLSLVDELPLASIPPYMISSFKFELLLPLPGRSSNLQLDQSWNFLSNVNATTDVCLVLQAKVSVSSGKEKHLNYEKWKKCNVEGSFDVNDEESDDCSSDNLKLFVLIGDGLKTPYTASLLALQSPPEFNFVSCHQMILYDAYSFCDCTYDTKFDLTKSLLQLSLQDVKQLEEYLNEWQNWMIEKWEISNGRSSSGRQVIVATGDFIINKFKEKCVDVRNRQSKCLSPLENIAVKSKSTLLNVANPIERRYLKRLNEISTALSQNDIGKSLSTPMKLNNNITNITVDDIITRVKAYVVEKTEKAEGKGLAKSVCPSDGLHDVFYNRDERCEKEMERRVALMNRLINVDTASSFVPTLENGSDSQSVTPFKRNLDKENSSSNNNCQVERRQRAVSKPVKEQESKKLTMSCRMKSFQLNERHAKKLRIAVVDALACNGIKLDHRLFRVCAKKLFEICKTFTKDVIGRGRTSEQFEKLAMAHVQQVVQFHNSLLKSSSRR